MELIDTNQDGLISFSEYVVFAIFIDFTAADIQRIGQSIKGKPIEEQKLLFFEEAKNTRVYKSLKAQSWFDARQTKVSDTELQVNLQHILGLIVSK